MAARRGARQPLRLAGFDRSVSDDRSLAATRQNCGCPAGNGGPCGNGCRDGGADSIRDDGLRLILTCCHPAIAPDARIALTLREVGGLTTEEIARAYLKRPVHDRAANRPGESEDPGGPHPLRGAGSDRTARASRQRSACPLSDLQRGLCGDRRGEPDPRRPLRRSGAAHQADQRARRRFRGSRPSGADASAPGPSGDTGGRGWRHHPAGRSGPVACGTRTGSHRRSV